MSFSSDYDKYVSQCMMVTDSFFSMRADHFIIYSKPKTLPLVAFGLKKIKDKDSNSMVDRYVLFSSTMQKCNGQARLISTSC